MQLSPSIGIQQRLFRSLVPSAKRQDLQDILAAAMCIKIDAQEMQNCRCRSWSLIWIDISHLAWLDVMNPAALSGRSPQGMAGRGLIPPTIPHAPSPAIAAPLRTTSHAPSPSFLFATCLLHIRALARGSCPSGAAIPQKSHKALVSTQLTSSFPT